MSSNSCKIIILQQFRFSAPVVMYVFGLHLHFTFLCRQGIQRQTMENLYVLSYVISSYKLWKIPLNCPGHQVEKTVNYDFVISVYLFPAHKAYIFFRNSTMWYQVTVNIRVGNIEARINQVEMRPKQFVGNTKGGASIVVEEKK